MNIKKMLTDFKDGKIEIEDVLNHIKDYPYTDLGDVKYDHHRAIRKGFGEVVFCEGKKKEHLIGIIRHVRDRKENLFFTRVTDEQAEYLLKEEPSLIHDADSRTLFMELAPVEIVSKTAIPILAAGTSDIPVVAEVARTCEVMGHEVRRINDVGVAGIHRLLDKKSEFENARVVVAIAGMEGALPGVVAGLIAAPVIAVPTSVGYGAGLGGYAAMLTMLNSCSPGVAVVNIDNGFSAGYLAALINSDK
ncbi:nickel pincer cofactor biosynthesis protein LarB [bacterium]|nr:nickel pincer cofactor biosynthesis protein LarB [bacterium]